jgi:dTDP-glucose 4,6-dehydratase
MKFLVTGGAGFIGGNFLHYAVNKYPEDKWVCLDALTYAGNMETIESLLNKGNFKFVHLNIFSCHGIKEKLNVFNL